MIRLEILYDPQTRQISFNGPLNNTEIMDIMICNLRRKVDQVFFAQQAQQQGRPPIQVVRGVDDRQLREGNHRGRD